MLKYLYLSLALIMATPTYGDTTETCYIHSELVLITANLRDQGVEPREVLDVMLGSGLPLELAKKLLVYVYVVGSEVEPEDLQVIFMNACVGDKA